MATVAALPNVRARTMSPALQQQTKRKWSFLFCEGPLSSNGITFVLVVVHNHLSISIGYLAPCVWELILPVPSTEAKLDGPEVAPIGELGAFEEPCELWIACWGWGS